MYSDTLIVINSPVPSRPIRNDEVCNKLIRTKYRIYTVDDLRNVKDV